MTAGKTPPLHVLRRIIRHIRSAPKQEIPKSPLSTATSINTSPPTTTNDENPLIKQVLSQYRAAQNLSPPEAALYRKMAYDFSILKKDLRERGELHKLDGGVEVKLSPKEMSRLAAHRAGLELPEEAAS